MGFQRVDILQTGKIRSYPGTFKRTVMVMVMVMVMLMLMLMMVMMMMMMMMNDDDEEEEERLSFEIQRIRNDVKSSPLC